LFPRSDDIVVVVVVVVVVADAGRSDVYAWSFPADVCRRHAYVMMRGLASISFSLEYIGRDDTGGTLVQLIGRCLLCKTASDISSERM